MTTKSTIDWTDTLLDQLTWLWDNQARPRLAGLDDAEYFWEPVDGCWNVRPRGESDAPMQVGSGAHVIEFAIPEPAPTPVTTIAWRLGHILVGVLGARQATHFGGPAVDYSTYDYPTTAADALDRLDTAYAAWTAGVRSLDAEALARPCGEVGFEEDSMARLVLHIHRELIHHLAEVALLRDLYLRAGDKPLSG